MSPNQILSILVAKWKLVTLLVIATLSTTIIVSLLLPKQYTAEAELIVDVKSPDPIAGVVLQGVMLPSYMATQVNVVSSERVTRRVIRALRLNESPEMRNQWANDTESIGDFEAWLAEKMQKNLEVQPGRESNIISISYTAVDPRFAAAITNAFVQAYIDTTIQLRVEPAKQINALFNEQLNTLRSNLESAQTKLSEYQQDNGLIATDERMDIENARLAELSSQLVGIQSIKADANSRLLTSSANSAEVLVNPVIAALKADLSRQEARLKEISASMGSSHPQYQQLQASINELRSRIEGETRRVAASLDITNSASGLRAAQISKALEEQRRKVLRLKQQRDQAAVLARDVENAQRAYDAMQARIYQSSLEAQANAANVAVLKVATPPAEHSSPKLALNSVIAVFLGGMFAIGLALAIEFSDRKIRSPEDISSALGAPLLGIMPSIDISKEEIIDVARPLLSQNRKIKNLPAPPKANA